MIDVDILDYVFSGMDDNPRRRKQFKKSHKTKYLVCTNAKADDINSETARCGAVQYYKLQFIDHKYHDTYDCKWD